MDCHFASDLKMWTNPGLPSKGDDYIFKCRRPAKYNQRDDGCIFNELPFVLKGSHLPDSIFRRKILSARFKEELGFALFIADSILWSKFYFLPLYINPEFAK
jgi:hypothetical protein